MSCYNHPNMDTVARCITCNKELCRDCIINTKKGIMCAECYKAERAPSNWITTKFVFDILFIVVSTVLFIIGSKMFFSNSNDQLWLGIILCAIPNIPLYIGITLSMTNSIDNTFVSYTLTDSGRLFRNRSWGFAFGVMLFSLILSIIITPIRIFTRLIRVIAFIIKAARK